MDGKPLMYRIFNITGILVLGIIMVLSIWQPVIPSSLLLKQMVKSVDIQKIALVQPAVIRFELSGKGGGIYNIVADNKEAKIVKGETDRIDLIIYMKAVEFNNLIFAVASGKADKSLFLRMTLSNILRFSGDIEILEKLFKQ